MGRKGVFKTEEGKKAIIDHYDGLIKGIPVDYTEHFADTSFGRTYVIETGMASKPKVIFFHGSCSNSAMWFGDLKKLSNEFHCFTVDILGEAGKSDENRLNLQSNQYADWINELLDVLGIHRCNVIGNSFGGWMALKFATVFPERVQTMTLIAPSGVTKTKGVFLFKSILYSFMGEKGIRRLNAYILGTDDIPQIAVDTIKLIFRNFKPIMGALPLFTDDQLSRLKMPVLYLAGENDVTMDAHKSAQRLKTLLAKPDIRIIENNGHVLYDQMDEIVPFLNQFGGGSR